MTDLQSLLSEARIRWMIGGAASAVTGHPLVDGVDPKEVDLRLLAVAGQDILMNSEIVPPKLEGLPDLAVPAFPFITGEARVYAHRVAEYLAKQHISILPDFLSFLEGRGVIIHPLDWTPKPDVARIPPGHQTFQPGSLKGEYPTAETWSEYPPSVSLQHLESLLSDDPDGGRALISELFKTKRADDRERMLVALGAQPLPQDIPFLESCSADASGKVRDEAKYILTRMGVGREATQNAKNASQLFERVKAGVLRRGWTIRQASKLNETQLRHRSHALEETSINAISEAMGLEPSQFIAEINTSSLDARIRGLLVNSARGLAPDLFEPLYDDLRRSEHPSDLSKFFTEYFDNDAAEKKLIEEADTLGAKAPSVAISRFGYQVPGGVVDAILKAEYFRKTIFQNLQNLEEVSPAQERFLRQRQIDLTVHTLPLIMSSSQATTFCNRMMEAGLHEADPRLYLFKINSYLKEPAQ
jgi:hypothetical protein